MTEKPPSVGVADSSPQGEPYRTADDRPYEVSAVWWCVGATIGRPL